MSFSLSAALKLMKIPRNVLLQIELLRNTFLVAELLLMISSESLLLICSCL